MADRNRSDLDREQRGSSNPQTERPEDRSTSSRETGMGNTSRNEGQRREDGVGSESDSLINEDRDSNSPSGNRSTGNIEGDENLDRR